VRDAAPSNIGPYDSFVQSAADGAGIGGSISWRAVGSTDDVLAINHVGALFNDTTNIPIYNQHGDLVSASFDGLWDFGLDSAVGYDQHGNLINASVWTGTSGDGFAADRLGGASATFGNSNSAFGQSWINSGSFSSSNLLSVYAMSQELTAVPVPAAAWLFGSGLLGIAGLARRKKPV